MTIGLVHDYLLVRRGAERTFLAMTQCWPGSPISTLLFDSSVFEDDLRGRTIRTSPLGRLRIKQTNFRHFLPLYPAAVERLGVADYDVIVSSSSAFAHGVHPRPDAVHVCYCHSPFRYAWFERDRALAELPAPARAVADRYFAHHRRWDRSAASRVHHYIANSKITQARIEECYGRESIVIHPPVDVERFTIGEPEDFFLTVCELIGHKRVEIALEAARRIGAKIKVVGSGKDAARLQAEFGETAEFLGRLDDEELASLVARSRALIVTNVEEFGIAAVEAQAAGRPVIATGRGGALETVVEGVTGLLVDPPTPDGFAEAMQAASQINWDPVVIRDHAQQFSTAAFQRRLVEEVARHLQEG
jgi:glycosyltransferase involved in cell wall biosynthesis